MDQAPTQGDLVSHIIFPPPQFSYTTTIPTASVELLNASIDENIENSHKFRTRISQTLSAIITNQNLLPLIPSTITTHHTTCHDLMMASTTPKSAAAPGARRKSSSKAMIITLKVSPQALRPFGPVEQVKEESKESSPSSNTQPIAASSSNGATESNANTPIANTGTPVPVLMPPPTEGIKKKGVKRSAGPVLGPDGLPKPRGKPGPKKKARLEDGTIDHSSTAPRASTGAAHKLGPKANQGAINAGLRALDRTGKPCRRWQKGSFKLKSFTGVTWEIPRWTAPPKVTIQGNSEGSASGDSSKENKDNSQMESEKSEKSNSGADVEMTSNLVSSPAPSLPPSSVPTVPAATATPAPAAPSTPIVTASA